jgi:L-fuculose-phosphate aldolase
MSSVRVESLRTEIVAYSRQLHANGWVANHDGNLTARLSGSHLLCTPTAVSKGDVEPSWLIVVDEENTVVEGTRRAFSELQLHRAAYAARPDISVVLHAHPPVSCGFAVSGVPLPHPMLAEAVVSLGPEIPMVPYFRPGDPALTDAIGEALQRADVIILERHGVLAVGGGFEQAYLRMELLEHQAKIALNAATLGAVRQLPSEEVAALSKKGRPVSSPAREHDGEASGPSRVRAPAAPSPQNVGSLVDQALKRFS